MTEKTPVKSSPGCLRKMFVGLGCGCVYPLVILLIIAVISWFTLAEAVSGILKPFSPPEFAGPDQEDFWTLQEKRLTLVENKLESVALNPGEFNALLAGIAFPPAKGFCLQRIRFIPDTVENHGQIFIIGSGFFMRSLIFRLEIRISAAGKPEIGKIQVNSWQVPDSGLFRNKILEYLSAVFSKDRVPEMATLDKTTDRFAISSQSLTLPSILVVKKR
jgi:hypothetical protein